MDVCKILGFKDAFGQVITLTCDGTSAPHIGRIIV